MADNKQNINYEIDLLDLIHAIWSAKWIIIGTILVSGLIGFIHVKFTPSQYKVVVPFEVNYFFVSDRSLCITTNTTSSDAGIRCMKKGVSTRVLKKVDDSWNVESLNTRLSYFSKFIHTSESPKKYKDEFIAISNQIKKNLLAEANTELEILSTANQNLLQTEKMAESFIEVNRAIIALTTPDEKVITIKAPSVVKIVIKSYLTILIYIFFGLILGTLVSILLKVRSHLLQQKAFN